MFKQVLKIKNFTLHDGDTMCKRYSVASVTEGLLDYG